MSGARRWSKFWWEDYEGDPLLSSCSLASQGLWMRMLCLMHRGEPYGHLVINGKQPSVKVLASVLRTNEREFAKLIAELEEYGVFSRTDDGTIYSRRMVKDAERSEEGREAVSKRWGNGGNGSDPITPPSRVPNGEAKHDLVGDLLHQEARGKKQERKNPRLPSEDVPPPKKRGIRIPESWVMSYELRNFALSLSLDAEYEADKFKDHYGALSGDKSLKLDWDKTFKNWCRLGSEFAAQRRAKQKPSNRAALLLDQNDNFILPGDLLN